MGIWDLWKAEAKDYVFGQLDASQCPLGTSTKPVDIDKAYVHVILRRMRIVNVRIATRKFYAAVHSDLGLLHQNGSIVNFKQLIAPPELKDVDSASFDRTIVSNQTLLGPTPYRGNALQLNLALVSVVSSNLAGPYLEVLSGLASAAGVSFISAAQPFLKPLASGIDLLTGVTGASMREIQVVTNLDPLQTGVFVVIRATQNDLKLSDLRVAADYALQYSNGKLVSEFPYVVASIEATSDRNDWMSIPELKSGYLAVAEAVKRDKPDEYKETLLAFRRIALLNGDLLFDHAKRLVEQVKAKMDELMGATLTSGSRTARQVPSLGDFNPFR
jgi:hypothetical protein